jgi:hypothetical protein
MDIVEVLKQDYQRFPADQTYGIYAEDVYFKDPVYEFRGLQRYRRMISWMATWFIDLRLDLHQIEQIGNQIKTRWTMSWKAPLPWKPAMAVSGWSELTLNPQGLIASHVDYWDGSRWAVFKQLLFPVN